MATQLPGCGRPLDYIPGEKDPDFIGALFPNALSVDDITDRKVALPMMTLRELTMLQLMNVATDKLDWNTKLQNPEIVKKWKEEALASGLDVTPKMVDWCVEELRYNASLIQPNTPTPPIYVYNGDVFKSDNAVSAELKKALQENVTEFESKIPAKLKDWHPGSDQKVWDLVHPSLFPLVYGSTRVLSDGETTTLENCIERCGQGKVTSIPAKEETEEGSFSIKFQWLPCEVDISGDQAKITSYINNLHPQKEKSLYEIISQLITASIPLWELTLAPLVRDNDFSRRQRIAYAEVEYEGPDDEHRVVVRPEPDSFEPLPSPPRLDLREVYGKRGLQVIVKLANIQLTPDKPNYDGGSWHVEGQLNEHIVATALYYYSNENITPSSLSFKQQCDEEELTEVLYEQDEHDWLPVVFGCEQDGPCVQYIGGVDTCEGRLLTFSNVLQHRVGPFKLVDPTKPGHRKIVAMFLVDPNIKVISTAHVPCQRMDWWIETLSSTPGQGSPLNNLPSELQDLVFQQVDDFPIKLKDAETLRLELMKERQQFSVSHREYTEQVTFSLCEH